MMTTPLRPKERGLTPHRKVTPLASKSWKESLRKACFERVRQRRRSLEQGQEENAMAFTTARDMVQEEMQSQGILLASPCTSTAGVCREQDSLTDHMEQSDGSELLRAHFYLSEEELFALLEEMETEMEIMEAQQVEALEDMTRAQEDHVAHQISEFQQWQDQEDESARQHQVPCPICRQANLVRTNDGALILCPNHMDGSCPLEVECGESFTLPHLRERLRIAYQEHAFDCHYELAIKMTRHGNQAKLVGQCSACRSELLLA